MKIYICFASNETEIIRENQTPQDILNLIEEFNHSIVVEKIGGLTTTWSGEEIEVDYSIIIYDGYIEY